MQSAIYENISFVLDFANGCSFVREWRDSTNNAVLAFMVFAQLLYLDLFFLVMVSFRKRKL